MDTFMNIVTVIGVIGVWMYLIWISTTVKNLKSMTDSTKNIFDSMKTSSDYFKNVHETAQSLHDPTVLDNVVKLRVELKQEESKKVIDSLQKEVEKVKEEHLKDKEHSEKKSEVATKAFNLCEKIQKLNRELHETYKNDVGALIVFIYFATNNLTKEQMNMFLSDEKNQQLIKENKMLSAVIGKKIPDNKETT